MNKLYILSILIIISTNILGMAPQNNGFTIVMPNKQPKYTSLSYWDLLTEWWSHHNLAQNNIKNARYTLINELQKSNKYLEYTRDNNQNKVYRLMMINGGQMTIDNSGKLFLLNQLSLKQWELKNKPEKRSIYNEAKRKLSFPTNSQYEELPYYQTVDQDVNTVIVLGDLNKFNITNPNKKRARNFAWLTQNYFTKKLFPFTH